MDSCPGVVISKISICRYCAVTRSSLNFDFWRMVATATSVSLMAAGVIASIPTGVTRCVTLVSPLLMSARKTPQNPSFLRWKNIILSLPHVGHPPFLKTLRRPAWEFLMCITYMSVCRCSISPYQPFLSNDATATFFPDGDTEGLKSDTPAIWVYLFD